LFFNRFHVENHCFSTGFAWQQTPKQAVFLWRKLFLSVFWSDREGVGYLRSSPPSKKRPLTGLLGSKAQARPNPAQRKNLYKINEQNEQGNKKVRLDE